MSRIQTEARTVSELDLYHANRYGYRRSEYKGNGRFDRHYTAESGKKIGWGDLTDEKYAEGAIYVVHKALSYGDYAGSTVERSNVRVFLDEYGDVDGVHELYGGYGSHGVAIRADVRNERVNDALCALESYPVLNEDDWSELEWELEQEARSEYLRDYVRMVGTYLENYAIDYAQDNELDVDRIGDEVMNEFHGVPESEWPNMFRESIEESGEHFVHEDPNLPYLDVEAVVRGSRDVWQAVADEAIRNA